MDKWDKATRSRCMSRIKSRDTKPELIVRRYLYARGYRYRKNFKRLPGTPDIVLKKYGVAIFIHGCFWHGHDTHMRLPKSNVEYWQRKIERNRERDIRDKEALKKLGWAVITVWECQLAPAVRQETLLEIEHFINHSYLARRDKKLSPKRITYPDVSEETPSMAAEPE